MNSFIKANLKNNNYTYNDMPTHSSSGSPLLDLFFLCGASRNTWMGRLLLLLIFNSFTYNNNLACTYQNS